MYDPEKDTRGDAVVPSHGRRKKLTDYLRDPEVTAKQARRGRIIELLADGWTQAEVSRSLRAGIATVGRVRRRYLEEGLDAAVFGYVAPGRAKEITDADESRIVAMVCSDPPKGRARWTAELIVSEAQKAGVERPMGRESVRLILKRHGLKPWQKKCGASQRAIKNTATVWATCLTSTNDPTMPRNLSFVEMKSPRSF